MSLLGLLTEEVIILRHAAGVVDDFGNPTPGWTAVETLQGRMEQRSGQERTIDGNVVTSDWVLYLPPSTVVYPRDRVTDRFGRTFEVTGPANMRATPQGDHHVEVSLVFVEAA